MKKIKGCLFLCAVLMILTMAFSGCNQVADDGASGDTASPSNTPLGGEVRIPVNAIKSTAPKLVAGTQYTVILEGSVNDIVVQDIAELFNKGALIDFDLSELTDITDTLADSLSFKDTTTLTSIKLPGDLTKIKDEAFAGCTGLTKIDIPAKVTSIGQSAFNGCTKLANISFKATTSTPSLTIAENAFKGCTNLQSIKMSSNVSSIAATAFTGCTALTSMNIPAGVSTITIPSSVTTITDATASNKVTSITFSGTTFPVGLVDVIKKSSSNVSLDFKDSKITNIAEKQFDGCSKLTTVSLPASLSAIGANAFKSTGLTSVTFAQTSAKWTDGTNTYTVSNATANATNLKSATATWKQIKDIYVSATGNDSNDGSESSPIKSLTKALDEIMPTASILIMSNLDMTEGLELDGKNDITIKSYPDSATFTIKTNAQYGDFQNGAFFTIKNSSLTLKNIILDGNKDKYEGGRFVYIYATVNNNATLTLDDKATITNAKANAGAICMYSGAATSLNQLAKLIMKTGATISNCSAHKHLTYGGGVTVSAYSTFEMNGGTITGNINETTSGSAAVSGAGVYVDVSATFTMTGGSITNNVIKNGATKKGGGVASTDRVKNISITGGTISNNIADAGYNNTHYWDGSTWVDK